MNGTRTQMICLWSGVVGIILFFVGYWALAGLVPPPSPHDSAREIQHFWGQSTDLRRLGLVITMIGGALTGPFAAVISVQLKRIEGEDSPLSFTNLGMGMLGVLLFIFPTLLMQAIAFRPHRDPQLMLLLDDAAWLPFVGIFVCATVQQLAIGLAILQDADERVFPRWLAYFNFWTALFYVLGSLIYFFKTGPFAWDGFMCFYVPLTVFGLWFFVMFPMVRRAILARARVTAWPPAVAPGRSVPASG